MGPAWKDIFSLSEADRDYYDRDDGLRFRVRANALLVGIVMYTPLGLFDIVAFPEDAREFLIVRAVSSVGVIAAYIWFLRATSRKQREIAIYIYCTCVISGFFALSTINSETAVYFHFGAAVALFYGGIAFFTRPALVIAIAVMTALTYVLSVFFSTQHSPLVMIDTALIIITILTLSGSNLYRDKLERADFINTQALMQAKKDAEDALYKALQADQAKDNLLAGVSHELRTPMNAIMGFSDAIRIELLGPIQPRAYRTYVDHIHSSGLILQRSINDMLDMSNLSMNKASLLETLFPLNEAVFNAVNLCVFSATADEIDLVIEGSDIDVTVRADRQRLEQALINLVANAIKFSHRGQSVVVEIHQPTEAGIKIDVSDDGRGISETALGKIKEPFVQEHADNHRRGAGGMGLGLAIVTNIIEAMSGSFSIKSSKDKGTTATIHLPVERIVSLPVPEPEIPARHEHYQAV